MNWKKNKIITEKLNKSKENVKLFLIQFYIPLKLIDMHAIHLSRIVLVIILIIIILIT